jgi:hypothetical protein
MSVSTTAVTGSTSVYNTPPFWERLWRTGGIQSILCFHHRVPGLRSSAAGRRVARRTYRVLRRRAHADPDRCGVLWAGGPQSDVVRSGPPNHLGRCRARRLGRSGNRVQRSGGSAFSSARCGGRSPRLLDRGFRRSNAHIRTQRLRVGRRRLDFVPAGHADHVRGIRTLAGPADFERALRCGSWSRRARVAGRHHVAERWILVTVRSLFAVYLAPHRRRVGPGREPCPLDQKSGYACSMVTTALAAISKSNRGRTE